MKTLKLVPFNHQWVENKIDIHAIYRRPRFVMNEYDEWVPEFKNGIQQWDLTTPLPVIYHTKYLAKGFQYVTLADRKSLLRAAETGTLLGGRARDYDQHQSGGPWHAKTYFATQAETDTAEAQQLKADVERFGPDAVEELRRRTDPTFTLPPELKDLPNPDPPKGRPRRASEVSA